MARSGRRGLATLVTRPVRGGARKRHETAGRGGGRRTGDHKTLRGAEGTAAARCGDYVDVDGEAGGFQKIHRVYDRAGPKRCVAPTELAGAVSGLVSGAGATREPDGLGRYGRGLGQLEVEVVPFRSIRPKPRTPSRPAEAGVRRGRHREASCLPGGGANSSAGFSGGCPDPAPGRPRAASPAPGPEPDGFQHYLIAWTQSGDIPNRSGLVSAVGRDPTPEGRPCRLVRNCDDVARGGQFNSTGSVWTSPCGSARVGKGPRADVRRRGANPESRGTRKTVFTSSAQHIDHRNTP